MQAQAASAHGSPFLENIKKPAHSFANVRKQKLFNVDDWQAFECWKGKKEDKKKSPVLFCSVQC